MVTPLLFYGGGGGQVDNHWSVLPSVRTTSPKQSGREEGGRRFYQVPESMVQTATRISSHPPPQKTQNKKTTVCVFLGVHKEAIPPLCGPPLGLYSPAVRPQMGQWGMGTRQMTKLKRGGGEDREGKINGENWCGPVRHVASGHYVTLTTGSSDQAASPVARGQCLTFCTKMHL